MGLKSGSAVRLLRKGLYSGVVTSFIFKVCYFISNLKFEYFHKKRNGKLNLKPS